MKSEETRIKAEESALRLDVRCKQLTREMESLQRVVDTYSAEVGAGAPLGGTGFWPLCVVGGGWGGGGGETAVARLRARVPVCRAHAIAS
jgi:hypothetical protein